MEYTVVYFEGGLGDNGGKKSEEDKDVHLVNSVIFCIKWTQRSQNKHYLKATIRYKYTFYLISWTKHMSNRYAPLPNPRPADHGMEVEMQAAFDYAEDDEDDLHSAAESRPLNPHLGPSSPQTTRPHILRAYDFESVDYDYPPPGSPPELSSSALPNNIGNSNGFVPAFSLDSSPGPRQIWFKRAAASLLPSHYLERWPLNSRMPAGPVGGGTNNDGVFANVTAKPAAPVVLQDGM